MDTNQRLINFADLKTENFEFTALKDSPYVPNQQIAFINNKLNNYKITFQTPYIITETYGLPSKDLPFAQTETRPFYKLPFCHDRKKYNDDVKYDKIEDCYNKMKELDDYFASDEIKEQLFGKKTNINMNISH